MTNGARDFDFLPGRWRVRNRRLRERLKGSTAWDEFQATSEARELPGGLGNEDVYRTDWAGGFVAMSFRFFDPAAGRWAIYWADNRRGTLDPPVFGTFVDGTGIFEGTDVFEGRPIRVRFLWTRTGTPAPRWEQAFSEDGGRTWETNWTMDFVRDEPVRAAAPEMGVVEFRRYTIRDGERDNFAHYFDAVFPEAFRQVGAIALGQFAERQDPSRFTWLRGFRDMDARAGANAAFYYGPLWGEHREAVNARIIDNDNVLLLRPFAPGRGVAALPAIDPLSDSAARGVAVAQIFAVEKDRVEAFARAAEPAFASYRAAGAREAGVLVTLDEPNNFPQHPVREDGPYLVWLGVFENDDAVETGFAPRARSWEQTLSATGVLRAAPEIVVLDPTRRSRLRWIG